MHTTFTNITQMGGSSLRLSLAGITAESFMIGAQKQCAKMQEYHWITGKNGGYLKGQAERDHIYCTYMHLHTYIGIYWKGKPGGWLGK